MLHGRVRPVQFPVTGRNGKEDAVARIVVLIVLSLLWPAAASANDSVAEIGAGGLVLGRSDVVSMESETLYLSMNAVRVDYLFRNTSDTEVTTLVAFPMPDIQLSPYDGLSIPQAADNFLGFTVEVGGQTIEPELQQRAVAAGGVDVTELVREAGFALAPFAGGDVHGLDISVLSEEQIDALREVGAILVWEDDEGKREAHAAWTLQSAYYWTMTFPADAGLAVSHSYAPALGQSVDVPFLSEGTDSAFFREQEQRYCMEKPFVEAARKAVGQARTSDGPGYTQAWLSYVLTTGANWAGAIGTFRLIVDKGSPENFVSFCGRGVEKTGPTTFELTYRDFWPERDLEVLFVVAPDG